MTQEKHDPWALLREARNSVALEVAAVEAFKVSDADKRVLDLLNSIDAALAEHEAKERYDAQADERKAIWRAYAERQLSEDEAKARLAALEGK